MGELDCHSRAQRLLAVGRGQVDEERTQPLPAGADRVPPDRRNETRIALHGLREPLLELDEVRMGVLEDGLGAHEGRSPTCSATLPPPRSLKRTFSNPAATKSAARSSGPGKRRTLAGR